MSGMNWVDLIILAIFFFSAATGFTRGIIGEIVSLGTLIASFTVATLFANPMASAIMASPTLQTVLSKINEVTGFNTTHPVSYLAIGLSFGLLFMATSMAGTVISYLFGSVFQTGILGFGNRVLGAFFGLIRGFLFNLLFVFLVQLISFAHSPAWQQSQMVPSFQSSVVWLNAVVSPTLANIKVKVGQSLQDVQGSISSFTQ